MNAKLAQAVKGATVTVTWVEVGINYDNKKGFPSLADLQAWATHYGLTITPVTTDGKPAYQISKV